MKESLEAFGGITVKDIIIYMTALYWVFRVGKSWYTSMTDFHDKQQEEGKEEEICCKKTIS